MHKTQSKTTPPPAAEPPSPPLPALRAQTQAAKPRKALWWAAGVLLLGLGGLALWQPWVAGPTAVSVEIAALAPVTRVLAVNGRIAAAHALDLRPLSGGAVQSVLVAEGDQVAKGQALVSLDATTQTAALQQAQAGLDAALVAQTGARDTYDRAAALGANIARSTLEAQDRGLQSARQEVARMTALVDQARISLENRTLHAPLAASVLALNVEPGQVVDPATVVLSLADLGDLLVEANVDESYAMQIKPAQTAVLQLAGESTTRSGKVGFVSSRVDALTGGLAIKIGFDAAIAAPVGLTVTANIVVDARPAALSVPRLAVTRVAGQDGVFLAQTGVARFVPLQLLDWPAARLIVLSGLTEGDGVITDASGLTEGQAISTGQP